MQPSEGSARLVARNFLALGSGEALARVVAFVGTVYVARTLGAASYGVISFAAAVMLYALRIADAGIEQGLGIREVAVDPTGRDAVIPTLATMRFVFSLGIALLLAAVAWWWVPEPDASVLIVMSIVLIVQGGSTRWIHLGLEQARTVALARTAGEAIMVVTVITLVRDAGDVAAVPLAQVIGDSVLVLVLIIALKHRGVLVPLRIDRARARALVPRATPLMLAALLGLIIFNSDLLFLRFFRDASAVGYYAAAYGLISFMINLGGAYQQSLLPTLTRVGADTTAQHELYHTSTAHVFAVTLPAALGVWFYAPEIITVIFGDAYEQSAVALSWLSWSVLLLLNRSVPNVALLARGREDRVFQINLTATVVNLALNVTLIPKFGILGAAWSTGLTELVRWLAALYLAAREGFSLTGPARLWKPVVAAAAMLLVVNGFLATSLWAGAPVGAAVYVTVLVLAGGARWTRSGGPRLTV